MVEAWRSYEEVAQSLIQKFRAEFGLDRVEGKQSVAGHLSGTTWEIDAKGVKEGDEGFVIIECRQYRTSRQTQEKVGALAWRILDTGARGALIVTPLGLQEGAKKVGQAAKVVSVTLNADCTPTEFVLAFLDKVFLGVSDTCGASDHVKVQVVRGS